MVSAQACTVSKTNRDHVCGGCLGWRCSSGKSWTFTCVSIMFLLHHLRNLGVVSDATASLKVPLVHDLMNCDE